MCEREWVCTRVRFTFCSGDLRLERCLHPICALYLCNYKRWRWEPEFTTALVSVSSCQRDVVNMHVHARWVFAQTYSKHTPSSSAICSHPLTHTHTSTWVVQSSPCKGMPFGVRKRHGCGRESERHRKWTEWRPHQLCMMNLGLVSRTLSPLT